MTGVPRRAAIDQGTFLFLWGEALIYPPRSDVAIDCGLFHTFSDADRVRFERSLHRTLRAGASCCSAPTSSSRASWVPAGWPGSDLRVPPDLAGSSSGLEWPGVDA